MEVAKAVPREGRDWKRRGAEGKNIIIHRTNLLYQIVKFSCNRYSRSARIYVWPKV